jgi:predicted ArsR family transcriptional regulator
MTTRTREQNLAAIGLLDEPVRLRVYDWVVGEGRPVGREETAQSLGISRALATFHLDRLAEAGLLDTAYRRLTGRVGPGAGRPARVYWRAPGEVEVSLPDRRYRLAADLFAAALRQIGGDRVPAELRHAARGLGEELGREVASGRGSPSRRLMRALERGGYEPIREKTGTIRLRNCPFDALVDEHRPLVCGTNLALSQGLASGAKSTGLEPVLDPQPGYCCVAFVPKPAGASQ